MGLKLEGFAPLLQVFDMPNSAAFYRGYWVLNSLKTHKPEAKTILIDVFSGLIV